MPASDLHDPEDRTATGTRVIYLFCADCDEYSGGGVCRRCEIGLGDFVPPSATLAVAILCHRVSWGREAVKLPQETRL